MTGRAIFIKDGCNFFGENRSRIGILFSYARAKQKAHDNKNSKSGKSENSVNLHIQEYIQWAVLPVFLWVDFLLN